MSQVQVGVGVLIVREGRVLLGRRRGAHGADTWSAPGGHLEFGESIEDCARREVAEETGLVLTDLHFGPFTSDVFIAEGRHYLTAFVLARAPDGEPRTMEPDKCDGWAWFDWSALPEPLFAPLASLNRQGFELPVRNSGAWRGNIATAGDRPGQTLQADANANGRVTTTAAGDVADPADTSPNASTLRPIPVVKST